jgi:Abi-like protein
MKYSEFSKIMTPARMNRYLTACGGNSRKTMTLYRKNLQLTQELFTVISCFEVALRNAVDAVCLSVLGNNWLQNSAATSGIFDTPRCFYTKKSINYAITGLNLNSVYSHNKLVAELGFGFWRYMFAQNQFNATGRILLKVFPAKPVSTPTQQYNNTYIFNKLASLNELRNRMAHHEPICFLPLQAVKDTIYTRTHYALVRQLFQWMKIDETALLYGLDHITNVCDEIDQL